MKLTVVTSQERAHLALPFIEFVTAVSVQVVFRVPTLVEFFREPGENPSEAGTLNAVAFTKLLPFK